MVVKKVVKQNKAPHLVIEALAGTGKTFSMIHGLAMLKGKPGWGNVEGNPQQEAIWDALCAEKPNGNVAFVAFNKSIATELQGKVPLGVNACTLHSLGFAAVRQAFGRVKVDGWKISNLCDSLHFSGGKGDRFVIGAIEKIVGLLKMNLMEPTLENLDTVCARYSVETNGQKPFIYESVPMIFQNSINQTEIVDFNDMVYFPYAHQLALERYELMCVDEGQDLNRCQQHLVMSSGDRIVLVGDKFQAIYGFAGADCDSIPRMEAELTATKRGCTVLPLTVTRRCPKLVVSLAQQFVPTFEAMPDAPEGEIINIELDKFTETVQEKDMVLCRVNAPLISAAFNLLKIGKRVKIQGREIGKGLTNLINKLNADNVPDLQSKLDFYRTAETERLLKKRNNEMQLVNLDDRITCIEVFMVGKTQVQEVISSIEAMFSDEEKVGKFVLFSSVHKAKGLEANSVYILRPDLMPHPMAKQPEDRAQETNLKYVAITRAMNRLTWVIGKPEGRRKSQPIEVPQEAEVEGEPSPI